MSLQATVQEEAPCLALPLKNYFPFDLLLNDCSFWGPGSITRFLKNVYRSGEHVGWQPKEISPLLLPLVQRAGEDMHVDGFGPLEDWKQTLCLISV